MPVEALAATCAGLQELFARYGYDDAVIFGHAKDGNIHFMLTDRFETGEQLARYADFTEAMVDLVLGAGGSLKAEHGTGRVMAPFVRRQYGDDLYEVMRRVKVLFDPVGLLNPGVLLDDDPNAHLRHIKLAPAVEQEVDRCVECGYCCGFGASASAFSAASRAAFSLASWSLASLAFRAAGQRVAITYGPASRMTSRLPTAG